MRLKILLVGKNWDHEDRHRAAMINHSLAVCPFYLLFKDHKGWEGHMGGPPPTRGIASANSGQNVHMSEIISLIVEPIVDSMTGGLEKISTADVLASVDELNQKLSSSQTGSNDGCDRSQASEESADSNSQTEKVREKDTNDEDIETRSEDTLETVTGGSGRLQVGQNSWTVQLGLQG